MSSRVDGWVEWRKLPDGRVAEIGPSECRKGHPLKYPNVIVGWDGAHSTYTCLTCERAGDPKPTLVYG